MDPCCPSCGSSVGPRQRFCADCGAELAAAPPPRAAPAAVEGARKQVTVLFADLVGSMELAERLGPDELSEVMQGLFDVCRRAVEALGGTVDKFTGDGIMALFGAPVALEDHATRAAHAALRLVRDADSYGEALRARGLEFSLRVGLHSGEVVAGSVGEAFTAVGHTVGLAQRMEGLAEAGTVRLTEHTAALLPASFALRDLGPTTVKGSSGPVGVFALDVAAGGQVTGERRRPGSARLAGRERELTDLQNAMDAAAAGRFHVFGIVGEAGAGKSRLCEELVAHATAAGVVVRRIAGVSHARDVELLPIRGLLHNYFAISATDSAAQIRHRVADRLLALDPAFDADLGLLLEFMEVPDPARPVPPTSPTTRRAQILDLFRRMTVRRTERSTVLFLLEDLHWFDPSSVEFVNAWLPCFAGSRTLFVTNFRPEFHAAWMGRSNYRQLALEPLDEQAGGQMLADLLGGDPGLSDLAESVLARAGGNPFFLEEIVRGLATDGTLEGFSGSYRWPVASIRSGFRRACRPCSPPESTVSIRPPGRCCRPRRRSVGRSPRRCWARPRAPRCRTRPPPCASCARRSCSRRPMRASTASGTPSPRRSPTVRCWHRSGAGCTTRSPMR